MKLDVRCTPDMLDRLLLVVRMGLPEKNGKAASAADCLPAAGQLPTNVSFCARDCNSRAVHMQGIGQHALDGPGICRMWSGAQTLLVWAAASANFRQASRQMQTVMN